MKIRKALIALIVVHLIGWAQAQTFDYMESNTDFILFSLSIPGQNPDTAYAAGSRFTTETAPGIVVKTVDKGETWTAVYEGDNIQAMAFATPMKGFAGGYAPFLMKTTDGGETWEDFDIGSEVYGFLFIKFYNESTGIIFYLTEEYELEIRTTADGGETWTLSENTPMHPLVGMNYADETTLYAVGFNGTVYKSEDGGNFWALIRQAGMDINMGVAFKDANTGVFSGENGDLYLTEDGGTTWTNVLNTGYHFFDGLLYKDDKIIAAGTDEDIYLSNNNGESFEFIFNGPGDDTLYDIALFEDNSGLITGSGGTIIRFDELFLNTVEIEQSSTLVYPNPATDKITVSSAVNFDIAILKDLTGKTVARVKFDGEKKEIDIQLLPAGVYILTLESKSQKETLRIIKK